MTPKLCRAARAILGWHQTELASRTRLSRQTVANYERGTDTMCGANRLLLEMTFMNSGVEFVNKSDECGVIVRNAEAGK